MSKVDASTIKLANTRDDAINKVNPLNITGFADGVQRFESFDKKKVLGRIIIDNPGEGYENKRRLIPVTVLIHIQIILNIRDMDSRTEKLLDIQMRV